MVDVPQLYRDGRQRVTDLVGAIDPGVAATPVAACPAWTVHDVVAHVTGVCADILAANIAGVASDPWTAAQVAARRDRPLADVVEEWSQVPPPVEALASNFPGRTGVQWVTALTPPEHDVRRALQGP